jgi:hypothetical protein
MCGLKEAYDQLKAHLAPHGHAPVCHTPGSWKNNTRRTTFTLAVDDFGNKHFSKEDADRLSSAPEERHDPAKDWTGSSQLPLDLL